MRSKAAPNGDDLPWFKGRDTCGDVVLLLCNAAQPQGLRGDYPERLRDDYSSIAVSLV
ncbi:MAG: hypothetical protein HKL96_13860 [Phycisphaerales bacterium]|nr:hypothetical protein [Phycisphaerales bacterium]